MDNNEATSAVMLRIQGLDPENACKIMGYILIHDPGEKEMIRLALGPETQLINLINQAKASLGLLSNTSSSPPTPPSAFNPMSNLHSRPVFTQTAPRIIIPNNEFNMNPSSPSSPWAHMSPKPVSYAAVVNGTGSSPPNPSFSHPFHNSTVGNEFSENQLMFEAKNLDFMDPIMSPGGRSDSVMFPYGNCNENHHHNLHRRSVSVSDVFLGGGGESDDNNGGWRPCMYFARGFCKNGSSCKFVHGGLGDSPDAIVGSPKLDGFEELLRMKAIQQQRFASASQLMAGGVPFPYNRCMNFLNESPRSAAATLMMGEEYHKFGRCRPDRNEFAALGFGGNPNASSRQIYLTFPADSTFKEEDVSNYFSTFGPVQDVRIPYQQKRMFGFVTFVYSETVKQILSKGNPHFVCDSRVLVKPYKEKGKVPDKKQQMEREEFPACLSPTGLDSREPYEFPFGGRVVYNSQEMMLRRKLEEQAELQQAIEYQGRRLMNFQLRDLTNHPNYQLQPQILAAVPIPLPTQSHGQINQSLVFSSDDINLGALEGSYGGKDEAISPTVAADQKAQQEVNESDNNNNGNDSGNDKGESPNLEDSDLHGSLEHILPDSLFASPTKSAADHQSLFASLAESDDSIPITTKSASSNNVLVLPTTSTLNMASLKLCYSEMPSH